MDCAATVRRSVSPFPGGERLCSAIDTAAASPSASVSLRASNLRWNRLPPPLVGAPQHRRSGRKRPALFSRHRLGARRRLAHQPGYSSACGFTGGASSDTRPASCCPRGGVKRPTGGAAAPVPGPSVSDVGVPARGHHSNAHAPPLPRSPTHHRGRSTPATVACIGGSGSMTASGGGDWRAVIGACDAAAARREVARLRWTAPRHVR